MRMEATELYLDWIDGLKDLVGRARIQARIERRPWATRASTECWLALYAS